ncbi:CoA-transferase family III domain-containing protein [Microdochium trichocladiopsis]|uniref:CoA-transferase family III domain-containing protein n=1 Tax=Microdochium trichocladiopsis TaxID=1682393 RepID=A0A9P9BUT8_9PEZI|nr:CoA-transferase family III domain-containing protein [Microdochium trichocladiopsis]KAH7037814.1 CoA-transferase family III domain-containing protein [Microdochium trichocladiopsis]
MEEQARSLLTQQQNARSLGSRGDMSHLPLHGITVLSLEQAIAAPFATRQLADLGARVIKVERPVIGDFARAYDTRVDGLASHFVWTNRSKESLALDLKQPRDLDVVKRLLKKTDVLVQNLAPGAADRLGLSFAKLKDEHPRLIVCDISGYGDSGPYRDKKAYDLLVQSEAGMLSVTGTESEPAKVGISIADIASAMYAYTNILAALMKRDKSGKGSRVDISMLESMAEWMTFPLYYTYKGQPGPKPMGASHASIYPYGPFETGDGGTVMLAVQNEREWANLCSVVLEDADVAKDPRFISTSARNQHRDDVKKTILGKFATLSADEVLARLDKAGVANAKVRDMDEVWGHEQLQARGRWTNINTSVGVVPALLPPGISSTADVKLEEVPEVGQHNKAIFAELGVEE